jgi:sigma-E factor negative regulatory protein RseB
MGENLMELSSHRATLFRIVIFWMGGLLLLNSQSTWADEATEWLSRAANAAQQLNYSGVYVYHHGEHVEVMRVAHRKDASGEQEKVEVLDDLPRQFLRVNKDVYCQLADGKTVRMEKNTPRRFFPALLPENPEELQRYYNIKLGGTERVAGLSCQVVSLEPRDSYRHGYQLWLDKRTGLPLKSRIVNSNGGVVSMFVFSEIQIGRAPDAQIFRQDLVGKKIVMASLEQPPSVAWDVTAPPGYALVLEATRPMPGKKLPVTHWVFSDGLSVLSLFIEPDSAPGSLQGLSAEGAMGVYTRQFDGHKITTLGEVPNSALIQTGNSVRKK